MRSRKSRAGGALLGAFLVATAAFLLPSAAPESRFSERTLDVLSTVTTPLENPRGDGGYERREERRLIFNVVYPEVVVETSTPVVSVTLAAQVEVAEIETSSGREIRRYALAQRIPLGTDNALKLSSTGFTIGPEEVLTKPAGTYLPTEYAWTVTPTAAGEHALLLNYSSFIPPPGAGEIQIRVSPDGGRADSEGGEPVDGIYEIRVDVRTDWWVGKRTLDLGRGALALIGFVLMYPAVSERLRRRLSAPERSSLP